MITAVAIQGRRCAGAINGRVAHSQRCPGSKQHRRDTRVTRLSMRTFLQSISGVIFSIFPCVFEGRLQALPSTSHTLPAMTAARREAALGIYSCR